MTEPALALDVRLARGAFQLAVKADIPARGITGVLGASGSGKTTLLRCIAGLELGSTGEIRARGQAWQGPGVFVPPHRRAIGFVFQEATLFPHLSVLGNLRYGLKRSPPGPMALDQAVELLGLGDLLARDPAGLSGGERQRVAIGRAILRNPAVILMDEPLASVDAARKGEILPFLERVESALTVPIVYVSHSIDEVSRLCDRLIVLESGRVEAAGELHEVLARPDLSLSLAPDAGVVLDGEVAGHIADYQLTRIRTRAGELLAQGLHGERGGALRLRVLARDVSLTLKPAEGSTILNILPAKVESLHDRGGGSVDVLLRVGEERLMSRISRKSCEALQLVAGTACYAQIKGLAIKAG